MATFHGSAGEWEAGGLGKLEVAGTFLSTLLKPWLVSTVRYANRAPSSCTFRHRPRLPVLPFTGAAQLRSFPAECKALDTDVNSFPVSTYREDGLSTIRVHTRCSAGGVLIQKPSHSRSETDEQSVGPTERPSKTPTFVNALWTKQNLSRGQILLRAWNGQTGSCHQTHETLFPKGKVKNQPPPVSPDPAALGVCSVEMGCHAPRNGTS